MISKSQQQQLEKYVNEFQACAKDGANPQRINTLLPEFYSFVGACKTQVEKELELAQDLQDDEVKAAEGLLSNLNALHSALLDTSRQLDISLESEKRAVSADHETQEIRINFEQCNQDSLKNIVIQAIRDTLDVEAPLADSSYTVDIEADHSIVVRVIHSEKE